MPKASTGRGCTKGSSWTHTHRHTAATRAHARAAGPTLPQRAFWLWLKLVVGAFLPAAASAQVCLSSDCSVFA